MRFVSAAFLLCAAVTLSGCACGPQFQGLLFSERKPLIGTHPGDAGDGSDEAGSGAVPCPFRTRVTSECETFKDSSDRLARAGVPEPYTPPDEESSAPEEPYTPPDEPYTPPDEPYTPPAS